MKLYTESQERVLEEQGVVQIHIRFRPRRLVSILFVLLLHVLFLYLLLKIGADIKDGRPLSSPMVMIFDKLKQIKQGEPEAKKAEVKTKTPPNPKAIQKPKDVPPQPVEEPAEKPPVKYEDMPPPDMSAMLNAARERRQAAREAAAAENQQAQGNRGRSSQEIAEENIRRAMDRANGKNGEGGLFTIINKGVRTATFSFRGWEVRVGSNRQVYEVDAGLGGNVELAIVKKMMEVIRTRFKKQAPWESNRLGRVIMISMAPEDSEETERFLMKEMFETDHPRR
jgi:type IV secretory pathway VirB10-like protein